jgi:hypothetical protein
MGHERIHRAETKYTNDKVTKGSRGVNNENQKEAIIGLGERRSPDRIANENEMWVL